MNWELKLIKGTMMVESMMQYAYTEGSIRPSRQGFSHEEVIAVYIHGIKIGYRNIKNIHRICLVMLKIKRNALLKTKREQKKAV